MSNTKFEAKKKSIIWTTPKEQLQFLLDTSTSRKEVLVKLGFDANTPNHQTLTNRIITDNLDLSTLNHNRMQKVRTANKKIDLKEHFTNGKYSGGSSTRRLVLRHNLIPYACKCCGNTGEHNNKPLTLQLDHIDGNKSNNMLENLRFLCPNCHSQTDTFSGRKNKKNVEPNKCSSCGKNCIGNKCRNCELTQREQKYKIEWPTPDIIKDMIWKKPTTTIAKELGVSDKAVERFCKKNNIPKPPRGFWAKLASHEVIETSSKP